MEHALSISAIVVGIVSLPPTALLSFGVVMGLDAAPRGEAEVGRALTSIMMAGVAGLGLLFAGFAVLGRLRRPWVPQRWPTLLLLALFGILATSIVMFVAASAAYDAAV